MIVIAGLGNERRSDDAVGLAVVRRLRSMERTGIRLIEAGVAGVALIDLWNGADLAILVDAVSSGAAAGTVHFFDATEKPLPRVFSRASTHDLGLADAVELARSLGRLPRRLWVYGVEGKRFALGAGLSREVETSVPEVALRIQTEIRKSGT